ncbi:3-hydroxyacyl-CoA dehydrogenase NAD-binding domain-containing protein [Porticoccaceae bacterium]|nr:3-hydroxyacyl-CoA dehydrogenase NAD-binding domain-containing protein [Porticoccaceae bacterium]
MTTVRYEKDAAGIAHIIFDRQDGSANIMDERFIDEFAELADKLLADDVKGVIYRSAKKMFFAGGDLNMFAQVQPEQAAELFALVERMKAPMRAIETAGVPVVAAINGAAMGGGFELCLASHYRVALAKGVSVGLPEVTLGLLPGGGGVTRMVRMLGLQAAMPYLTEGRTLNAAKAQEAGLIDELVSDSDALLAAAVKWIEANPQVVQPWDQKGYRLPGGSPSSPALAGMIAVAPAVMRQKTRGRLPAPEAILSTMVEGAQVDFDTASRIESRFMVELATGSVCKNLINTFWTQMNEIKAGVGRPNGVEKRQFKRVAILGAGMMGAGIAWACASRGIACVLKDVSIEAAEKGKAYSANLIDKQIARGRADGAKKTALLGLIATTDDYAELADCDLVIEAVFESRPLKAEVTAASEAVIAGSAVFASNTSTLPITGLAEASVRPEQFIGLHFFSPVDKMPLVEIIVGAATNDKTLAEAYDFVQQIGKTPIVVNDSRGFYTSRVFGTYTAEGMAMVEEGIAPASIENGAYLAGYPVGPLAVSDEVTLTLQDKVRQQTIADYTAAGEPEPALVGESVLDKMLNAQRAGKSSGGAFYDYPTEKGGKKSLWPGLAELFPLAAEHADINEVQDRLLYIQAIETLRCREEGVITTTRDANIGAIMGIGYPAWTGGTLQFINSIGSAAFVARADQLAAKYGERFAVPQLLRDLAATNALLTD